MMKGKKHGFHPKSYPIPPQLPNTAFSRNQNSPGVIKGGTLQVASKQIITRTARSPVTDLKKAFDIPTNPSPKLMTLAKQVIPKASPIPGPKILKHDPNKSLKKSLSNNDLQQISNITHIPPKILPIGRPPVPKRHSPSPTQQLKSPSPPRTAGPTARVAKQPPNPKAKIGDFQFVSKTSNASPQLSPNPSVPWAEFLYFYYEA